MPKHSLVSCDDSLAPEYSLRSEYDRFQVMCQDLLPLASLAFTLPWTAGFLSIAPNGMGMCRKLVYPYFSDYPVIECEQTYTIAIVVEKEIAIIWFTINYFGGEDAYQGVCRVDSANMSCDKLRTLYPKKRQK